MSAETSGMDDGAWIVERGLSAWPETISKGNHPKRAHHPEHDCFTCAVTREALGRPPLVPLFARRWLP